MPFQFRKLEIPDVVLIRAKKFGDLRGFFMETYKKFEFAANGIEDQFIQDNYSHSNQGVLRGLHFQKPPVAQAKLVMVFSGKVFDVAVDIRKGSPTFGKWVGATLSAEGAGMLYIPPGFAHGFCVVSETADFTYKVSAEYSPENEGGIAWNDPVIGIEWPVTAPKLSDRDKNMPLLQNADIPFRY
ncbi:MAG TPA: dTDP-4-dehydrorhamnose 3,5-epimerase [Bacteroidetes bacterium]|nr:dTDP-4-dehydrorhamnose 3,5-epimerase [Bacteroidota bacterium]